jgi:hypothetical protein
VLGSRAPMRSRFNGSEQAGEDVTSNLLLDALSKLA